MSDLLLAILKGLFTKVALAEIGAACSAVARWLVKRSAMWLIADRERYEEQWLADLEDRKTPLRKLLFAVGLLRAAAVLRRESRPLDKPREELPLATLEELVFDAEVREPLVIHERIGSFKGRRDRQVYRDPVNVIDESIDGLMYLAEWVSEDLDMPIRGIPLTKDDIRSLAALRAIRAALPRLRILRSNFEMSPTLPDASSYSRPEAVVLHQQYIEQSRAELRRLFMTGKGDGGKRPDARSDTGAES